MDTSSFITIMMNVCKSCKHDNFIADAPTCLIKEWAFDFNKDALPNEIGYLSGKGWYCTHWEGIGKTGS